MSLSHRSSLGLFFVCLAATGLSACSTSLSEVTQGDGVAEPHAVLIDRTTHALTSGELQFANGTYTSCTSRTGAWSLDLGGSATMTNPALTVVKNDTACVLTLTSIVAGSSTPVEYLATPDIGMDASFKMAASRFAITSGLSDPVAFFANAKLSAVSFAGDFDVVIKYSDDPSAATGSNTAGFAVSTASAAAQSVPSPDYTVTATTLALQTDSNSIVQSPVTGYAQLNVGSTPGQTWIETDTLTSSSYSDVDTAYGAGTPAAMPAQDRIPAAAFNLVGADLTAPVLRYLLIANTSDGVRSYEVVTITFNGPS